MTIFTIGFTKKSAKSFFEIIKSNKIKTVIDIRLNTNSQLAGFSKGSDLEYFLEEICKCGYCHETIFSPTKELKDSFQAKKISLIQFETDYMQLMKERNALTYYEEQYAKVDSICLLCSEDTPEHCHRRILAEVISSKYPDTIIKHL